MRAIKNFIFCWIHTFMAAVLLIVSLVILMPVRFFTNRESFTWSAEHEADSFSDEMLKFTLMFRELILKKWSQKMRVLSALSGAGSMVSGVATIAVASFHDVNQEKIKMNNWNHTKYITWAYLVPIFIVGCLFCWIINFAKLTDCDFKAPYKCEAIHGSGILPLLSLVTVWFDADEVEK